MKNFLILLILPVLFVSQVEAKNYAGSTGADFFYTYSTSLEKMTFPGGSTISFNAWPIEWGENISKSDNASFVLQPNAVYQIEFNAVIDKDNEPAEIGFEFNGLGDGRTFLVQDGNQNVSLRGIAFVYDFPQTVSVKVHRGALTLQRGDSAALMITEIVSN